MEELDEFGIPIKKQTSKVTLDEFGIPIKKKEESKPTATPQKLVSGTTTGSSGGVNPAFKNTTPSLIPDFNSMKSVKPVVVKPQVKLQKPPVKEEDSFMDYLKENLDTGLATVSKSVYDAPGLIYDAAASITNPIIKGLTGYKGEGASSDKLAKDLGFRNIPSEILKEKIKVSNEKINAYSTKNGGDALQAVQDGNYVGAAKLVAGTTAQSLPIMVAAMLSGGETTALSAIGLSTASTKNAQLKEENPEMGLGTRVANAANAGIIEAVTGHLFTGASGAVMKKIIADKGVDVGSKIIGKSFKSTIEKSIEKNPLVGAIGEVVEESAVEFGNQVNDMSSGIRTEFDFHAIKNAGLSATGMGGLQTLGVYGAKGYVKAKTYTKLKSNNKEVFKLRNEIENGNLSDANKAILTLRAERLEAENKKLLGTELEKAKALPTEAKTELNALNAEFEDLKSKFDGIDDADDIPENLKPAMKEEIRIQASKNQKRKTEILSQNDGLEVKGDFSKFEGVEPDFDLENGKISSLPLKEQNRLNKLAVEEITKGDKTIEYTKEQVSETANEIYKNEQTPPTPEAQPQAEVPQQAEAEKVNDAKSDAVNEVVNDAVSPVEDVVATSVESIDKRRQDEIAENRENLRTSVNSSEGKRTIYKRDTKLTELYDGKVVVDKNGVPAKIRIDKHGYFYIKGKVGEQAVGDNEADARMVVNKTYKDGVEVKTIDRLTDDDINAKYDALEKQNEATPSNDITPNASIRPTASNVGESGITIEESPAKEGVSKPVDGGEVKGDVEVSDLDHAKSQIDKGVLLWNGDSGAERVNLGIPWADIRKGEADIKRGKPDTVPAKRLIEALKTAKEKGGYEYIQGRGGVVNKQFVSLEDIQRSTNEYDLTDAEQKHVDANQERLAKEYEAYFEALDIQTQNDIYENKEGINGLGEETTPSGESKNDVPNKEKQKSPTAKEKVKVKEFDINDVEKFLNQEFKNTPKEAKKISDQVRKLKVDLSKLSGGGLQSNPLGLPVAIWNTSMDIIATSIDAGMEIADAIKRGMNYIQKNHRGAWDKKGFNDSVLTELGVRGITVNGKDMIVKDTNKEYAETINGFYSDIEQSLLDTKKDNLTAKEWENVIGKSDEAKWTGLTDFINSKEGKISKNEINDFLKNNRIEIIDVEKSLNESPNELKRFDEIINILNSRGYDIEVEDYASSEMRIRGVDDGETFLEDRNGGYTNEELISDGYTLKETHDEDVKLFEEAEKEVRRIRSLQERQDNLAFGDTKFSQYQLEGEKENYKEVLVTMPEKFQEVTYSVIEGDIQNPFKVKNNNTGDVFLGGFKTKEKAEEYAKSMSTTRYDVKLNYRSSHFDEPNILVHLRMNTRIDSEGKKVLFLEEVQSDWGQEGKKKGFSEKYKSIDVKAVTEKENSSANQPEFFWYFEVPGNVLQIPKSRYPRQQDAYNYVLTEKSTNTGGTPTAPFVTDTNSWTKLGVKTALKEAINQGVDKIAWTTGEQQNSRYDLSKQVDKIDVEAVEDVDGLFFVDIKLSSGTTESIEVENGIIREGNHKGQRLDDVIGKDYADKVMSTPKGEFKTLQGDDLKVGGKGMKGFYGSTKEGKLGILGEVVKALTKQEPKTASIIVRQKEYGYDIGNNNDGTYNVGIKNGDLFGDPDNGFTTKQEAKDFAVKEIETLKKEQTVTITQHSIDITPQLKAEVKKGMPMFGNLKEQNKALANAKIDRVAAIIKKATKADINPDDYKLNGFAGNQDKLIDLIADAAKKLVSAKIDLDEAIRQVINSIKAKFGDFDVNIDEIKERINPKKEAEKESSKDMEDFRDSWNLEPSSDEINQYDSGRTIKREHGELRNNQDYEVQKDYARVQIGIRAIEHAKRLFGAEYVEKTLSFIEQANLSPEKKAVAYVLLENEMDARVKEFPKNVGVQKLQDLVRAKSQEFLANSARAMGAGRFRIERFRELAKNGFSEDEFTNAILTTKQINDKAKIQKLIQVSPDDVNNESEYQESDEDFIIEEPTVKRNKEAVKKDISNVLAQMRKDLLKVAKGNAAMSSIPYAAQLQAVAPHIIKLSKLLAELGGMTTRQIVNEVYNDIKEVFPGINKTDVSDILKEHSLKKAKPKTEAQKKQDSVKEIVKKALIEKGFSREITVTKNERDASGKLVKDAEGRNVKTKEKRTVLDWKKLAGEAGTIDNIRKNVEESLKGSKYSKAEIAEMKKALEREYVRLTSDVIEKGLNELQNRNAERKPVNTKSAAKKLAELYNYGLFEKNKDSYEKIINSVLGFNGLDQSAFNEMKEIARGYAVLMDSGLTDTELKSAVNSLSRRQSRLVATLAFSQADWKFKLAVALSEITNLSTRFKLVNLGNLAENVSSGMMARAANNMMDAMANIASGKKTSSKAIRTQSKINARAKLRGITLEAAESYGDTSSLLLNHSAVEDYFNNATTNRAYHALISTYMAKPVLEGADSFNKILITEAKMVRAAIKVLEAKGMSNSDALDYVANAITGESMKEALAKAKELIEKVNEDAGRKLLNDSESSIKSLAADIVKESLVSGGQLTETELKAIYSAAYKSAGKDIGHVSNNWVTDQISAKGAQVEKQVADAIKEKKWSVASGAVINQIIWKNFISTFVGGGTNWFVKGLQKSANPLSLVSLRDDMMKLKMAGKLDVTTDEGIKNMEEALYRGMNLRSTSATMLMGAIITASIIGGLSASGGDDEIAKWLKENKWAKKYFDKLVPDAIVLMLAIKDKDFGRYIAKMVNVKADFFDDQKNIVKIIENYAKGYANNDAVKISDASGDLGVMLGKRFEFPAPRRAAKDAKQIYKGLVKGEYNETNYYTSGFMNGFLQGGVMEGLGLRPEPDFQEQQKKGAFSPPKIKLPSLKFNANPK